MMKVSVFKTYPLFLLFFYVSTMQLFGSDNVFFYLLSHKDVVLDHFHISDEVKESGQISPDKQFGSLQEKPAVLSAQYQQELEASYGAYEQGDFKKAAKLLGRVYRKEPDNPFILDQYARSLYRFNRRKSFKVYSKLIELLDSDYDPESYFTRFNYKNSNRLDNLTEHGLNSELIDLWNSLSKQHEQEVYMIDCWFQEAYWKKGTLHLDRKEYLEAALEITRSLYVDVDIPDKALEQAFSYLTEAYFFLGKFQLALNCAARTKEINRENKYVDYFIGQITLLESDPKGSVNSKETLAIFNDLYKLVKRSKKSEKNIAAIMDLIKEKVDSGALALQVNELENEYYLSGADFRFEADRGKVPLVYINRKLVDLYKKQPSLVYSVFIHELKHAADYFTQYDFFISGTGNRLEKYLFEMDAAYLEALFIETYLEGTYSLTKFEQFLLGSKKNDNLAAYSIYFQKTDMKLIYHLARMRNSEMSEEECLAEMIGIGTNLIEQFDYPADGEKWRRYSSLVPLYSFQLYVPQIYYEILYNKRSNEIQSADFQVKDYSPELDKIINTMWEMVSEHKADFSGFFNENLKNFDTIK